MLRVAILVLVFGVALSAQAQTVQPVVAAKPAVKKPASPKRASASRPGPPQPSGPCIGVVSLIGDHFAVKKIGLTVFGNEYKDIPSDSWGLDDLAVERIRAAIGPGIAVRRIAVAKDAFATYQTGYYLFGTTHPASAALVEQAAGPAHCERYVVVSRGVSRYIGNQDISGVGIVNSGSPILSTTAVFAVIWITVHDGRTYDVLKRGMGSTSGMNLLSGPPIRRLEDFTWPELPEATDTPRVRDATRALLTEAFDKSLPDLLAP